MPGNPVMIGPFNDGLNNVSTSGEAKDSEVAELINMEVGEDGSLRSRPPFQYVPSTYVDGTTVNDGYKVLGIYQWSTIEWYLIVSKPGAGSTATVLAVPNGDFTSGSIITIANLTVTTLNKISGYAQIDDWGYFCFIPGSTASGFRWSKTAGYAALSAMPKGTTMASYKSRLWIAGQTAASLNSRLYFSTIDTVGYKPDQWNTAVDYFDVAAGEGGFITALLPLSSSLLVFKDSGTYRFSYASSPKGGQVDKVNGSIGAANPSSVVEHENYVYVYDQGRVYELVNNTFRHINRFVKFAQDSKSVDGTAPEVDVSIVNRRVIVRYFNTLYVYSIDTQSWSQWRTFMGTPGKFIECPADSSVVGASVYMAPSMGTMQNLGTNEIKAFTDTYRAYMASYIGGGTVSFAANVMTVNTNLSGTTTAYLNNEGGPTNYNIRLSSGHKFKLTGTLDRDVNNAVTARMTYLLNTGATSTEDIVIPAGAVNATFTAPSGALAANLHLRQSGPGINGWFTMQGMVLLRDAVTAPVTVIKIEDEYKSSAFTIEYIDCVMRTKSYDYKVSTSYKRLFWWAADLKSTRYVTATLIPMAVKQNPTWGDLEAYTHAALEAGTWGNPLKFLSSVLDVQDGADPSNSQTENGRILMKFKKSIRFKQASFKIEMGTLGNEATGPVKIHNLITFVQPKEKVTERTN